MRNYFNELKNILVQTIVNYDLYTVSPKCILSMTTTHNDGVYLQNVWSENFYHALYFVGLIWFFTSRSTILATNGNRKHCF